MSARKEWPFVSRETILRVISSSTAANEKSRGTGR